MNLTDLPKVGPKLSQLLNKANIYSPVDLLFHFPSKYQNRSQVFSISQLSPGQSGLVKGKIGNVRIIRARKAMLVADLYDGMDKITLRFFHFHGSQLQQLKQFKEKEVICFGELRYAKQGLEMIHPEYQLAETFSGFDQHWFPVYPAIKGIGQKVLQTIVHSALEKCALSNEVEELMPAEFLQQYNWPSVLNSLRLIHRPPINLDPSLLLARRHPACQRLIVEELTARCLTMLVKRQNWQGEPSTAYENTTLQHALLAALPFDLTSAQKRVLNEIGQDLAKPTPMLRLVQGDVGSGKTVLALLAAAQVLQAGDQVALMAPTEILAKQHFNKLRVLLAKFNIEVVLLVGSVKTAQRRQVLEDIVSSKAKLVIGTHALFQQQVEFAQLGLVIIDEQHRFGVAQRLALSDKGRRPHQLVMTATPIPRTLTMVAYADLAISVVDELPPGRQPIKTVLMSNQKRMELVERVKQHCAAGKQVYWVCPLVEASEQQTLEAVTSLFEQLQQQLAGFNVGLLHGRLSAEEKTQIMNAFQAKKIHVLIATTVIEVGVDVANASLMIVENAERFGLAQLHQLRGRVGRGSEQSYCVLLYQSPLGEIAKERLTALRESSDGFILAETDWQLRGPGEILGTQQAGFWRLKVADWRRDQPWIEQSDKLARRIMSDYPGTVEAFIQRWLGDEANYWHA